MRGAGPSGVVRGSVRLAVLGLLAAAAGLAFAPAFGGRLDLGGGGGDMAPGLLVAAVLAGALAPALVVGAARGVGASAVLAAAAGLLVAIGAVVAVARPGTAVLAGPFRLLTSALPADPTGPTTAGVGLLVGFASLTASLLAAYSRHRALAVLPALGCLLAALAVDAGVGAPPTWYAAPVIVLVGATLAASRGPLRPGRVLAAAVVVAAGALVASAFAPHLPAVDARSADARNLVAPPLRPRNATDPMQQYPAFARGVETVRLQGTSSRRVPRLTLVTLPDFTGRTWTGDARFRRAGRVLQATPPRHPVTVDVTATNPRALSWLVRPDRPTALDRGDLGVDETTGDIVVPGGVAYPTRYRISGGTETTPTPVLAADHAVRRSGPVSSASGVAVPAAVTAFARRSGRGPDSVRLQGLQNLLRTDDFFVDDTDRAPSGSGYFQIQTLLQAKGRHLGTSEQYASAFAVMARALGYESRLVLGFAPRYAKSGRQFTISGADVQAWPQVRFARAGWVSFDPTPTRPASAANRRPAPAGANPSASPSTTPTPSVPPTTPAPPTPRPDADRTRPGSGSTLTVAGGAALVLVLLLATPPGVKAGRRRRRRRAPVPAHAIHGAWREAVDRLTEAGRHPPRGRTTSEVAASAPRPVRDDVRALGRLLDHAGYAPEAAGPQEAASAWRLADTVGRRVRADLPAWRRVRAALDPRPLRRHGGRRGRRT
ncbi:protein of unknown function [Jatrophihabitans endophyticus]|uniref:Transglutaminase-like domain-containing protein n=1 Tax=Jatrophihabitans endophyticus TaxID=1206085 RepID=A0A1M5N465_9ACTN|nr:transglutaminaseTgpA domain-containing protein [Jatrophihabitans endophyticus]SHG83969.1 protein of unknown function [Jatrophihabitans endophyticus]